MVGHGGSSAGSYLADPISPIPSHCAVIFPFKSVPVHQFSWLALLRVKTQITEPVMRALTQLNQEQVCSCHIVITEMIKSLFVTSNKNSPLCNLHYMYFCMQVTWTCILQPVNFSRLPLHIMNLNNYTSKLSNNGIGTFFLHMTC